MSNYFSKNVDWFRLIIPKNNLKPKDPFNYYNITENKNFKIEYIKKSNPNFLAPFSEFLWFNIPRFFYSIKIIKRLSLISAPTVVYTRDPFLVVSLIISKKLNPNISKIFFEAHKPYPNFNFFIKLINGIIVINNYNYNYFKILNQNTIVEYMGVDLDRFQSIKFKESKKVKNVTYIGSFQKWKGVDILVNAFKYLDKNYKLILVGANESQKEKLILRARKLKIKNIEIKGYTDSYKLIEYFNDADVFILPNSALYKENLSTSPIKLFEYMASKRLIIASNINSLREILNDNNAVFFKSDDPQDLANKINLISKGDYKEHIEKAFDDVQHYTWEKRSKRILNFIFS